MQQENRVGIDVSAVTLDVVRTSTQGQLERATFNNDASGHKKLITWVSKRGTSARVCLEATGVYSLKVAMALYRHPRTEVMVANPRAIRSFAQAMMQRAKTDLVDARVILAFVERMPFEPWQPPSDDALQLQSISRRIEQVKVMLNQELNRRHAHGYRTAAGRCVVQDIEAHVRSLRRRIDRLEAEGVALILSTAEMAQPFERLISVKGIATTSALRILAELLTLPEGMRPEQWVAHAGLDPRPRESGTSINKPRFISRAGNRHLRHALYMPALVALRHEPNVKAFYQKLLAAGKKPMQAVVAVMRKLLRCIWGMLMYGQDFDGSRFYQPSAENA